MKLLGASSPSDLGKCLLGRNSYERDKKLLNGGVGGPTQSPRGSYGWGGVGGWTPRSILGNYASGSCSVVWATWGSTKKGTSLNGKSTSSHWIHTNGRGPKTCVGEFGDPIMGWVVRSMRNWSWACVTCAGLALVTLARVEIGQDS